MTDGSVANGSDRRLPAAFTIPVTAVFAVAVMGYACWAAFTGHGRVTAVRVGYGTDSRFYIAAAKAPVWSMKFLATPNGEPPLFLVLAKVCLRNLRAIVLLQSAVAVVAWLYLAHTVVAALRSGVARGFAFLALLLLGMSPQVLLWNAMIATESLSVSVLCVAIALWIRVAAGADRRTFAAFVVALVALAATRDTNAYLLLAVAAIAFFVAFWRIDLTLRSVIVGGFCVASAFTGIAASNHAGRWFDPLNETIAVRLLHSKMATSYLHGHGMPLNASVRELGKPNLYPFLRHSLLYDPQYKSYRTWVLASGRTTYTNFLLTHPAWDFSKPFDDRNRLLVPDVRNYAWFFHNEPRGVYTVVGSAGFPESQGLVEVWIGLVAAAAAVLAARERSRSNALLRATGAVALLVVPHFLVAWHGDALEMDRHSLAAAVQLRIVLWIITALALDALFDRAPKPVADVQG